MLIDARLRHALEIGMGKCIAWQEQGLRAPTTACFFMSPKPCGMTREWEHRKRAKQLWVKYAQLEASRGALAGKEEQGRAVSDD